jgi:hypothetical protein
MQQGTRFHHKAQNKILVPKVLAFGGGRQIEKKLVDKKSAGLL